MGEELRGEVVRTRSLSDGKMRRPRLSRCSLTTRAVFRSTDMSLFYYACDVNNPHLALALLKLGLPQPFRGYTALQCAAKVLSWAGVELPVN